MKYFIPFFLLLFTSCGTASKESTSEKEDSAHDVQTGNMFLGDIRKEAKTSFVSTVPDTFVTIKELHKWLPDDKYMHENTEAAHNNTPRTPEEAHNVCVEDLYILGIKREDDNDFHLILASFPSLKKDQPYFTAEISGLPDSSAASFATLAKVRREFVNHIGSATDHELVFVASDDHPPIHLQYITGSLFFDNHHFGSHSSVKGFKVCSAWEIHPVTAIKF